MHTSDNVNSCARQEVWERKWSHGRLLRYAYYGLLQECVQLSWSKCYVGEIPWIKS